jgi:hypothetical protein
LAHGAKRADLSFFIIVVSLLVPSLFAAMPLIASVLSKKAGRVMHGLVMFIALFFVALPVVKRLFDVDIAIVALLKGGEASELKYYKGWRGYIRAE